MCVFVVVEQEKLEDSNIKAIQDQAKGLEVSKYTYETRQENNPILRGLRDPSHAKVIGTPTITLSGVLFSIVLELDKIEHVEESVISLGDYLFNSFKTSIIKGIARKR